MVHLDGDLLVAFKRTANYKPRFGFAASVTGTVERQAA
jgi:hypothetical protein